MASVIQCWTSCDPHRLSGVFRCHSGEYLVSTENLETYLSPKKQTMLTRTMPHQSGRGIAYTRSAFAYLFERVE
jgi:hypothetical protein